MCWKIVVTECFTRKRKKNNQSKHSEKLEEQGSKKGANPIIIYLPVELLLKQLSLIARLATYITRKISQNE